MPRERRHRHPLLPLLIFSALSLSLQLPSGRGQEQPPSHFRLILVILFPSLPSSCFCYCISFSFFFSVSCPSGWRGRSCDGRTKQSGFARTGNATERTTGPTQTRKAGQQRKEKSLCEVRDHWRRKERRKRGRASDSGTGKRGAQQPESS